MFGTGANEFTIEEIESFLNGEGTATPAVDDVESSPTAQSDQGEPAEEKPSTEKPPVTETQAFARRLREETTKVRAEERESIAKSLGYESFAAMQSAREKEILEARGLDPDDVMPAVEQLVEQRLAEDPRLRELDSYRQERMTAWAQRELAELSQLTEGRVTTLADVPKDVLELWKTKGSLKAAYMELHGEALIREMRASIASGQSRGSTGHMKSPQGTPAPVGSGNKRPFTQQEKDVYRLFNPNVTEEELSRMTKEI